MSIMNKIGSALGVKKEKEPKNPYEGKNFLAEFPPKHPSRSVRRAHSGRLKDQIAKKKRVNSSRERPILLGKINYPRSHERFNPHKAAELGTQVNPFTGHRFD